MMNRSSVHLVVINFVTRTCSYTLHSINASRFFYPTRQNRSEATAMEYNRLPPPAMTFHYPCSLPKYYGGMEFMSLGRSKKDIIGVDHERNSILYDTSLNAIRTMPMMHSLKWFDISIPVANRLYVMKPRPGPHERHTFEALVHGFGPCSPCRDWYWRSLPPPPYIYDEAYDENDGRDVDQPYDIGAYTVIGDSHIWMSTTGAGTYSFDTVNGVWSKRGEWSLPFTGRAEYVPEHNLWFGFSSQGREGWDQLCASDVTAQDQPTLINVWELDLGAPQEWIPMKSYLMPLGSGKFCIAKQFEKLEEALLSGNRKSKTERFVVLLGVEVERRDGNEGVELRMIKHKSKCYKLLGGKLIHQVL